MKERRGHTGDVEIREVDGQKMIEGHAIVFNSESNDLGGFRETIKPEAMNGADVSDVVALFNHDPNRILGRTPKTLSLSVDDKGLRYSITPPSSEDKLVESIERNDVRGSSFAFSVAEGGDEWLEPTEKDGLWRRTITKFERIFDVSPVVRPAYSATDTEVAKRSLGVKKDEIEKLDEQKRAGIKTDLELYHKRLQMQLLKNK